MLANDNFAPLYASPFYSHSHYQFYFPHSRYRVKRANNIKQFSRLVTLAIVKVTGARLERIKRRNWKYTGGKREAVDNLNLMTLIS